MRFRLRTLLIVAALAPPALAYLPGYFLMGNAYPSWRVPSSNSEWLTRPNEDGAWVFRIVRRYPHKWQKELYRPLGKLEAWLRGIEVYIELPPDDERRELAAKQLNLFKEGIGRYVNDVGCLPPDLNALLTPPRDVEPALKWKGPYLDQKQC